MASAWVRDRYRGAATLIQRPLSVSSARLAAQQLWRGIGLDGGVNAFRVVTTEFGVRELTISMQEWAGLGVSVPTFDKHAQGCTGRERVLR
jgi:hypothetical protein